MSVGYAPSDDELEPDPFAVAGPNPGAGPAAAVPPPQAIAPAPESTVMSPLGQIPASAIPAEPNAPPQRPPGADDQLATPAGAAGPGELSPPPEKLAAPAPPPRPTRPPLTGDAQKDISNSLSYERQLDDWHAATIDAQNAKAQPIAAKQAADELKLQQDEQKQRDALRAQQLQERQQRQTQIDDAVKSKMTAQGDLESGKWRGDRSTGSRIASALAIFGGGIGAGLSAAGGHPTGNLVLDQINKTTDREYEAAKDRLSSANESVLAARYGYKDTADNQRAALNDLDADFSARHKLIAAQADNSLKQSGLSPEQRQANELVAGSLAKSAQYEDNIHAREIEAGRKNELADSTIEANKSKMGVDKSKVDANEALADWRNRRKDRAAAGKGAGGLSKAAAKDQEHELKGIEHAADKEGAVLLGSARSQGAKVAYESAQAVANELRRAAASGDPDAMKIAVMHAQEQSTRFLTGSAPTQQTFEIQHGLAGTTEQLEAKLGGILGQPTEAKSYVNRMAQNIDAISRQRKEVLTQEGEGLKTRLESIVKSDEGRRRAQGVLDQFLGKGAVKLGGGSEAPAGPARKQVSKDGVTATYEQREGHWVKVQ